MKVEYAVSRRYNYYQPMFEEDGRPTDRVLTGVENVLGVYEEIALLSRKFSDDNPRNYTIDEIYVVGSGARINRIDSDMDLMIIAPNLDNKSCNNAKMILSMVFFNDRSKVEAIDVYVRPKDKYPERAKRDVTKYLKKIVKRCNSHLV